MTELTFICSCSYDYLEIMEVGVDNSSGAQEWQLRDHHEAFSSDTEVDEASYKIYIILTS